MRYLAVEKFILSFTKCKKKKHVNAFSQVSQADSFIAFF